MCLVESGKIPHLQSIGFFCGDPKINFAYKGDTVKPHVLILVALIIPFVVVCLLVVYTYKYIYQTKKL